MKNRIALHSVPRSGSTWLGSIFDSHPEVIYKFQPLFSYRFKGRLTLTSNENEIIEFFNELTEAKDEFLNQEQAKSEGNIPIFDKANPSCLVYKSVRYHQLLPHLLKTDQDLKVVGLIRNPISTIYSWSNSPKGFRKDLDWKIMDEWKYASKKNQDRPEEYFGYEKWKEVAYLFTDLADIFSDRFKIITYTDLLQDTDSTVRDLFSFANLDFSLQTKDFLINSRSKSNKDAYSVFKTKECDDVWRDNLDPLIIEAIRSDLEGSVLEKYLDKLT